MTSPVVVCSLGGTGHEPPEETEAALTLARQVAHTLDAEVRWLILGPAPADHVETAARQGVASVDLVEDEKLDDGQPDALVEAIVQYCGDQPARLLLFNQNLATRLVAPRVAARLNGGVVMNGTGIDVVDARLQVTAAAYGGDTRVECVFEGGGLSVVALLANSVAPVSVDGGSPGVNEIDVHLSEVEERIRVLEPARAVGARLEDAEVIVAGGRGLGTPENFELVEELAKSLGGMAGASRPIVDEGWIDSSHQVGLTGKITRPALYLAAGISGATQHMVGCSAAKTIVAINTDPDAAIFRHCRYGVVADCSELLPELIRAVKEAGDA